jgi:hypothetical protein
VVTMSRKARETMLAAGNEAQRLEELDWPCDRRDAHGPHDRTAVGVRVVRTDIPVYLDGAGRITEERQCPGVKAHPLTMAGRGELPTRPGRNRA